MLFDFPTPDAPWRGFSADPLSWIALLAIFLAVMQGGRPWAAVPLAALALVSPLAGLGRMLATGQAVQMLVLIFLTAPALARARPLPGAGWAAPLAAAIALWQVPRLAEILWFHAPGLPAIAVLVCAWGFWSRTPAAAPMLMLGASMTAAGAAVLASDGILYPHHIEGAAIWGLPALLDQWLAGLVLGVGAGLPLLIVGALLLRRPAALRGRP